MALKTRTEKHRKLIKLREEWAEKYEGRFITIQGQLYKVHSVWIQGISYEAILGIKFKTDSGWISIWDGIGRRPSINKIKAIKS